MPLIIPQNSVQVFVVDGGGKLLRIIMNEAPFDQYSPGVFPRPRGSGSRTVLRIGTNSEEVRSGLSQESNDGRREGLEVNALEVAALFHGFNDVSGTQEDGDAFFNRPNYPGPVPLMIHLFVSVCRKIIFKSGW